MGAGEPAGLGAPRWPLTRKHQAERTEVGLWGTQGVTWGAVPAGSLSSAFPAPGLEGTDSGHFACHRPPPYPPPQASVLAMV